MSQFDPRELVITTFPPQPDGVIAKATHLPTRRFTTAKHRNAEVAKKMAVEELERLLQMRRLADEPAGS